jgi:hypothetical protein
VDARYDTEHSKFVAELSQQSAALAPAVASVSLDIGHGMLENQGTLHYTMHANNKHFTVTLVAHKQ